MVYKIILLILCSLVSFVAGMMLDDSEHKVKDKERLEQLEEEVMHEVYSIYSDTMEYMSRKDAYSLYLQMVDDMKRVFNRFR